MMNEQCDTPDDGATSAMHAAALAQLSACRVGSLKDCPARGLQSLVNSLPAPSASAIVPPLRLRQLCSAPMSVPCARVAESGSRTKLVVRRLPPGLSEEAFLGEVASKLGCLEGDPGCTSTLAWHRYLPGRAGPKRGCPSLAYLSVRCEGSLAELAAALGSLSFLSERGASYRPHVEYAPSQRVPRPPHKRDARQDTLDQEPEYAQLLQQLAQPAVPRPSAETLGASSDLRNPLDGAPAAFQTPLMAFLKQRSEARQRQRAASGRGGGGRGGGARGDPGGQPSRGGAPKAHPRSAKAAAVAPEGAAADAASASAQERRGKGTGAQRLQRGVVPAPAPPQPPQPLATPAEPAGPAPRILPRPAGAPVPKPLQPVKGALPDLPNIEVFWGIEAGEASPGGGGGGGGLGGGGRPRGRGGAKGRVRGGGAGRGRGSSPVG